MTELSDDLLVAYVDGQLARDQSAAIKRVLDHDEVAAERVAALRSAHARLEAAFEALLDDERALLLREAPPAPVPAPAEAPLWHRLRAAGGLAVGGACLALVLSGAVLGYALSGGGASDAPGQGGDLATVETWQEAVTRAHALFGRETLEVGLESQGNIDLIRFQLAGAIGVGIVVPELGDLGLTFKRAQLLRRDGEPVAQIAYLPEAGEPVALYAKHGAGGGAETPVATAGLRVAAWEANGISYLLAGAMAEETFARVAAEARRQTSAP